MKNEAAASVAIERETQEQEIHDADPGLTRHESERAVEHQRLSALTVFAIIRREGDEELHRPLLSLWWSGVAAGIGISSSVLAQGILTTALAGQPQADLIAKLGYTVGFVLVILSRLQLFTENTLSVVLPALSDPSRKRFVRWARLWAVVLAANLLGTLATAWFSWQFSAYWPDHLEGMLTVSRHAAEPAGLSAMLLGIPAGFFIAALVWMLPSAKGFELPVIIMFTWLIAAGGFTHVIAGSTEMFLLAFNGELGFAEALLLHLLPTLAGNIIGGTGLFAMLAYGQIHAEI